MTMPELDPVVDGPPVEVGDIVLYTPDCAGDRCGHPPSADRAAVVNGIEDDGTLSLSVFHPGSVAMQRRVPHDPGGAPRSWRPRPARGCHVCGHGAEVAR